MPKTLHQIDPLTDRRWDGLIETHLHSSVFHSRAWLDALRRTYNYEPVAYTTSSLTEILQNAIVFCRVNSWLTGNRLVSVPFSDHCDILIDQSQDLQMIFLGLEQEVLREKLLYFELRPTRRLDIATSLYLSTEAHSFHQIDLEPDLDTLFRNLHKDSTQRKITRANREGLIYKEGRTESLLDDFYRLFVLTRRRHGIPPQPRQWFRNLIECFGETLKIRVAFNKQQPVASILTLRHKDVLVYKYGCSDVRSNSLGGMHMLFWRSIQEAKNEGLRTFDLGRSDLDNPGLIVFKQRWGATESTLKYLRYSPQRLAAPVFKGTASGWRLRAAKRVFAHTPKCALSVVGSVLYKHVG